MRAESVGRGGLAAPLAKAAERIWISMAAPFPFPAGESGGSDSRQADTAKSAETEKIQDAILKQRNVDIRPPFQGVAITYPRGEVADVIEITPATDATEPGDAGRGAGGRGYIFGMRVVFLGTGTSHGIPVIGCRCRVCLSPDPRNRRNRLGIWLSDARHSLILDVSPDFRQGALRHGLDRIDAALLTHAHADHVSGLDDLRIFSQVSGAKTPLYGAPATLEDVKRRFGYAFVPPPAYGGGAPQFDPRPVTGAFSIREWNVAPLPVLHGPDAILGYRIGDFALITDVTTIPDATLESARGLKVLALDCLRERPHSTHLCLDQAVDYARRIGAERTYFIHMCHDLEHGETEAKLPPEIRLAYDGLEFEIT
jgi:phosphoribosyl 1,2-cyclic phosphate phosphodiesterase